MSWPLPKTWAISSAVGSGIRVSGCPRTTLSPKTKRRSLTPGPGGTVGTPKGSVIVSRPVQGSVAVLGCGKSPSTTPVGRSTGAGGVAAARISGLAARFA